MSLFEDMEYDPETYVDDYSEFYEDRIRIILNKMNNDEWLYHILTEGQRTPMNTYVDSAKFGAYDIAYEIYKNKWIATERQRKVIDEIFIRTGGFINEE